MNKIPRAFRPKRALLLAVAPIVENDEYLQLSDAEFVALVMKSTGGSAKPDEVLEMFRLLRDEAGC